MEHLKSITQSVKSFLAKNRIMLMKIFKVFFQFVGSFLALEAGFIYAINVIGSLASNPNYSVSGSDYVPIIAAVIIFIELVALWINNRPFNIVTMALSIMIIPLAIFIDLEIFPTGSDYEAPIVIWLSLSIWIIAFIQSRLRAHIGKMPHSS